MSYNKAQQLNDILEDLERKCSFKVYSELYKNACHKILLI